MAVERVSVGAQGLSKGSVTLGLGPHCLQGISSGSGAQVSLVRSTGVASGALNELVDAHGLVPIVGSVVDQAQAV
jgi:hypothetical protein